MRPLIVALGVVAVVASVAAVVFAGLYFTSSEDETSAAEQCEGKMFGRISDAHASG